MNENIPIDKFVGIMNRVLVKSFGTQMWALNPEKGYQRPIVITHNGEWYVKVNEDNEYFKDPHCDYEKDIENGIYVPIGIKVGEEENL